MQKWRSVVLRGNKRLETAVEHKRHEIEERQAQPILAPQMARQKLLEEKKQEVERFKQESLIIKSQAEDELKRQAEEKNDWLAIIRKVKTLQLISRKERELEREREQAESEEKARKACEEMRAKREEQKLLDKQREREMSKKLKLRSRRKKKQKEKKGGEDKHFMCRFRKLQEEAKERKRKEKMRKLREEEKRLEKRKKSQEKELVRRAEVKARLDYMLRIQEINDVKRIAEMEEIRKKHEAECAKYDAENIMARDIVEQIKKHAAKIKQQSEKNAQEKLAVEKELKKKQEMQRRKAVSTVVSNNRKRAHAMAERLAKQLQEEEAEWRLKKEQRSSYNQWARDQWAKRAQEVQYREMLQRQADREHNEKEQQRKTQAELLRREEVQRRIERNQQLLSQGKLDQAEQQRRQPDAEARNKVLSMQRHEHQRKIQASTLSKREETACVRNEAEEQRRRYIEDRENALQECRDKKQQVLKRATKKVWR